MERPAAGIFFLRQRWPASGAHLRRALPRSLRSGHPPIARRQRRERFALTPTFAANASGPSQYILSTRCFMLDLKGNRVTYFGHSTFSLTTPSGQVALIDPWVMTNPVCPENLKKVSRLDVIFLSHAHSDHLGDFLALAKQHKPQTVAIFETGQWIESKG